MTRRSRDLYIELAELVRANVSGPVKRQMVASAQKKLIDQLQRNGILSPAEAEELTM